ncbi:F-box/LRR-repeat protein At2g29930-like [Malus domestica]|uniref:F-box/LRR-repeat protein At2g29930-like n=1 Tax=Malus domestica TaxID=3750 RepID=UPI003974E3B4
MSVNGIWEIRQTLPFCLLSHLKTIFIKGFKGQRDEMEVAKYLLKNNVVLDKMATSTGDLNCTKEEMTKIKDYESDCSMILEYRHVKLTTNITRLIFPRHVDNVLFSRNSSDIQKFTLCCNSVGDFSRVDGWIRAAIRRNDVELDLDVGSPKDEIFELPQSLFSCKTLMDLTLMSNFIIKPPTSGCFPSLKSLRLDINHPQNNSMEKLFSCCPVLESLFITGSHGNDRFWNFLYRPQQTHLGDAVLNFIISAPELKTLRIYWNSQDGYKKCSFFIAAPKLVRFDLNQNVLTDCFLENAKSLVNATIDLWEHSANQVQRFAIRSTALLAGISNVKYLFLRSHRLKFDPKQELEKLLAEFPAFFFHRVR